VKDKPEDGVIGFVGAGRLARVLAQALAARTAKLPKISWYFLEAEAVFFSKHNPEICLVPFAGPLESDY
jgi:hypothetical protein